MGVKGLWELVSPTGEMVCLGAHAGEAVAVDLAGWLVDTQSLQLGHLMTRPHLRNLFFRTVACLQAGVLPVMVLEGKAPSLKWNTISSRNQRTFGGSGGGGSGKRSRFDAILKKCTELFDLLGVPWVRAVGEAEATCAALNYHKVVQGVITQDSDVFLYGGNTVFRNFTANQKKVTAEKFRMELIDGHLQVTRGGMLLLAIVLGCDYLPGGVHGIGKDTALRYLRASYIAGNRDPTQRLKEWAAEDLPCPSPSELASTKWKKGNDDVLEDGLKKRLVATEGFPFTELLTEFTRKLPLPLKNVKWARPDFEGLVGWCVRMLDWEGSYVVEKVAPVVTRWTVTQGAIPKPLQPISVLKRCVKQGVVCLKMEWRVNSSSLPPDTPQNITTDEPLQLLQSSFPQLVHEFEELTLAAKKDKKKKKKTEKERKPAKLNDKGSIDHPTNKTITQYFKSISESKSDDVTTKIKTAETTMASSRDLGRKMKEYTREEEDRTRRRMIDRVKDEENENKKEKRRGKKDKATKGMNQGMKEEDEEFDTEKKMRGKENKDRKGRKNTSEEEEEVEDSECDERELSFIIDRMLNMKMRTWNKQEKALSRNNRRKSDEMELNSRKTNGKKEEKRTARDKAKTKGNRSSTDQHKKEINELNNCEFRGESLRVVHDLSLTKIKETAEIDRTEEEEEEEEKNMKLNSVIGTDTHKQTEINEKKQSSFTKQKENEKSEHRTSCFNSNKFSKCVKKQSNFIDLKSEENMTSSPYLSLYDRATKRLSKKDCRHSKPTSIKGDLEPLSANSIWDDDSWSNVAVIPKYKYTKPNCVIGELGSLSANSLNNNDSLSNINHTQQSKHSNYVEGKMDYLSANATSGDGKTDLDSLHTNDVSDDTWSNETIDPTHKHFIPPQGKIALDSLISAEYDYNPNCSDVHENPNSKVTMYESTMERRTERDGGKDVNIRGEPLMHPHVCEEVKSPTQSINLSKDMFEDSFPGNSTGDRSNTLADTFLENSREEMIKEDFLNVSPSHNNEEMIEADMNDNTFPNSIKEMIKEDTSNTLANNFFENSREEISEEDFFNFSLDGLKEETTEEDMNDNTFPDPFPENMKEIIQEDSSKTSPETFPDNTIAEDELSANTLAVIFEKTLALDSSSPNLNNSTQGLKENENYLGKCIRSTPSINKQTQRVNGEESQPLVQQRHEDWERRKLFNEDTTPPLQDITNKNSSNDIFTHTVSNPKPSINTLSNKECVIEGKDIGANGVPSSTGRNSVETCKGKEKFYVGQLDLNRGGVNVKGENKYIGSDYLFGPQINSKRKPYKNHKKEENFEKSENAREGSVNEKENIDLVVHALTPVNRKSYKYHQKEERRFETCKNVRDGNMSEKETQDKRGNHVRSPQKKSLEIKEKFGTTQNKEEGSIREENNNKESLNKKENISHNSGSDSCELQSDSFSPERTYTLAQRLRLKCSDKRLRKLLDDLR